MNLTVSTLTLALILTLVPVTIARGQDALSAQDMADIHNLYARYNLVLDAGDSEAWADTFTPDGTFNDFAGRAALVQFAINWHASNPNTRHWNSNIHLIPNDDGAAGTAYLILWNVGARPQTISLTATYEDALVKTPAGWRFKSRRVTLDLPAEP